ncbi:CML1 [Symbiodinium sp. CCMP2456]|nr:CML1 [Symbiodinium sp. CCMP2456]
MVTEVYGSGQDAHVDHANVDDVAAGDPIDFLDMTRQSPSRSDPRRVVPTISIIVYFNSVGGIRFPYADGMQTIAGKRGRMIFFENYDDGARPMHATSATHYGIYFEQVPKRILVMGVLANKTPSMDRSAEPTKGLIYCAGTERDPLFHDNPSYDQYNAVRWKAMDAAAKPDLIVSLDVSCSKGDCAVLGRNLAGEEVFNTQCSKDTSLKFLMDQIKVKVDPGDARKVILCRMDGQLLTEEHMSQKLDECFKDLMEGKSRMTASTCFGLCGSSTSP